MHLSLKARSVAAIIVLYLAVGLLTLGAFLLAAQGIVEDFGRRFAEKHVMLDKNRILAPIQREVALARKLVDSPLLKAWLRSEGDPALRAMALQELESYRRIFVDGSYFFVHDGSRHYYFNNAQGEFTGRELRYLLNPKSQTDAWYFAAMRDIQDFTLHVDSSEQLGVLKVWINAVVWDNGHRTGMGGTGMDLTRFLQDVVRTEETGVISVMMDPGGTIQAHPDRGIMTYNARMKDETRRITLFQLLDGENDRAVLRERLGRLKQDPGRVESFFLSVKGQRYLVAATGVKAIGWVALVLVDPSRVVGLRAFVPILVILVLSLLLTILLVSYLLNRVVLAPLGLLTISAREIARGNYQVDLPAGREDEIGELNQAFQHMQATVRDYTSNLEEKVRDRTEALSEANERLFESNRKIMDSLEVAKLLQSSLLPRSEQLRFLLQDHFTIYQPRDLVGGDFFAIFPDLNGFLLVMADCTGHGVPGALMTMSARAVLKQLLVEHGPEDPARLLRDMNRAMKATLHQETGEVRNSLDNGLEMALMRVSRKESRIRFASARIPLLVYHRDRVWEELPGDRHSLGYRRSDPDFPFDVVEMPLEIGDTFYLMTDGILDQSGGPYGYGLGRARLRTILDTVVHLPLALQRDHLLEALGQYQGRHAQRDDITFLGFRLEVPPKEE